MHETREPESLVARWPRTRSERLGVLTFGVIAGIDGITFSVVIASLLFSGALSSGLGIATSSTLLCTAVIAALVAWRSQIPNNVAHVQDTAVAVLAAALATTSVNMEGTDTERVATAFAIVGAASLVTGVVLWVTGRFGLGRIVKYFPQPVLAGFMAGTGWLLIKGGVSLAVGFTPTLDDLDRLTARSSLELVGPAALGAIVLALAMRRKGHPVTLLATLGGCLTAFYLWLAASGSSLDVARGNGYVPQAPTSPSLQLPFPDLLDAVRWSEVGSAAPTIGAVAVLCLFATLLNSSGLERLAHRDIDMDGELRTTGIGNVLVSLAGAPPGYSGLAISALGGKAGVRTRGSGVVAAVIVMAGFLVANQIVAHVPNFVSAALTMYLGAGLLHDWVLRTLRRYSRGEWLTVLAIVAVVAVWGFLPAMVAGLVICTLSFAYSYARIPIIRYSTDLAAMPSTRERSGEQRDELLRAGRAVEIVRLQGYLFFGTAEQVLAHVRARLNDRRRPTLRALVLDFTYVANLDSASAESSERLVAMADDHGFTLVLSSANRLVGEALQRAGAAPDSTSPVHWHPSLDLALEAVEQQLLADALIAARTTGALEHLATCDAERALLDRLLARLTRTSYAPGDTILSAGEPSDELLFVESGTVLVMRPSVSGPPERLRAMSAGSVVGDVGVSLGAQRSADIVAEGHATIVHLPTTTVAGLERDEPELALLVHRIVSRALAEKVLTANRMTDHVKG